MTQDQKFVAVGGAGGVVATALLLWVLAKAIPPSAIDDQPADRLAYALPWAAVAVLPLLVMIVAIGNSRFRSGAIDPTVGKEDPKTVVDCRVAENTLQQFVLFLVGMLALAVTLRVDRLSIIAAVSITFVLSRLAFWIGYRIKPAYRAPGFASTASMNAGMLCAALWLWAA